MVIQDDGVQAFSQGVSKSLRGGGQVELANVETFWSFCPLRTCLGFDPEVEFRDDETVIGPTLRAAHGLGDTNVLSVPLSDDDIIDEMPVL